MKKEVVLIGLIALSLFLVNFVRAELYSYSDMGVKYETEILSEFESKVWIDVIIDIKDLSNITISNKDSIEIQIEKDKQRNKFFNNITESILDTLSNDKFRYKDKTDRTIFGYITEEGFDELLNNPNIKSIYLEKYVPVLLSESAPLINVTYVWNNLNYTGDGQTICIVDTGIDYTHPDLGNCTQSQFLAGNCNKVPGGYDYVLINDEDPMDTQGHGTHVAGIVASQNETYKGIAPDAKIVAVRSCMTIPLIELTVCLSGNIKKGLQWCYNNRTTFDISVVSMSVGGGKYGPGNCTEDWADSEINDLYNVGIPTIIASGNNGYTDGIAYPACSPNAISVGSTKKSDTISSFTNRASNLDLLAPGGTLPNTHSCPTNNYICSTQLGGGFIGYTGTSMATPHVAGAAALMLEKNSTLTPDQIKQILQATGKSIWDPDTQTIYPRIDVAAAIGNGSSGEGGSVPFCNATSWSSGSCGAGTCTSFQREETRTVNPSGCADTSRCEYDESCVSGDEIKSEKF